MSLLADSVLPAPRKGEKMCCDCGEHPAYQGRHGRCRPCYPRFIFIENCLDLITFGVTSRRAMAERLGLSVELWRRRIDRANKAGYPGASFILDHTKCDSRNADYYQFRRKQGAMA